MDNPEIISPMAITHRRQTQQHSTTQHRKEISTTKPIENQD
jgi:hypothetical protein